MATPAAARQPRAGKDYPTSYGEFRAWFPDDRACADYLDWLRWPTGFACPECRGRSAWRLADGRWWCGTCRRRVSATARTIFHRTKTPLTVWFAAAWYMTSTKSGVSAKTLHRLLGFGSYQTSWTMLHNFRKAMVRQGRERLAGDVEVDEAMFGGSRPGKPGRGALGKQIVGIAVEQTPADGFGRCRLSVIANAEAETLRSFLWDNVEPGARVLTDGLGSYRWAVGSDYVLAATPVRGSGKKPHDLLPGVHRVTSLVKRWLLGTHQGAVRREHMQAYLDEFTFRFNRRRSNARGLLFYRLLQQAALTERVTYRALVAVPKPRKRGSSEPKPLAARHAAPPSLRMQVAPRPWR